MTLLSIDLAPTASGVCVFGGEDRVLHLDTILPPKALSVMGRQRYTVAVLRLLCELFEVSEVALEDYAHKLRSSAVTAIREQGGAVKQVLIDAGARIYLYNVSVIKQFATGHGGANTEAMLKAFRRTSRLRRTVTEHEVDAWFIGRLHYDNVRRRLLGEEEWPCTYVG